MSGVSDYGGDFYLSVLLGIATAPSGFYVALLIDEPQAGFDGTILADIEPTDANYARVLVPNDATFWSAPDGGFATSLVVVTFPVPAGSYGVITNYALCSAATAGEIYAWGDFDDSQLVDVDNPVVIPIGGLTVTIAGTTNSIAG